MIRPRYEHDCDQCRFVGHLAKYDIYVCPSDTLGPSYIARFGNEGGAYTSRCDFGGRVRETVLQETAGLLRAHVDVLTLTKLLPSITLDIAALA